MGPVHGMRIPGEVEPWEGSWTLKTQEFKEMTNRLGMGELFHDPNFSLFEAMSAIELMDPKMDAGMIRSKRCLGFQESVEAGELEVKRVSLEEEIGTMDATWSCVVTWIEGHSLVQTVFTNLYLHNPDGVEDGVMKAFSLGILKFLAISKSLITRAGVFEEEDFQPMTYDFDLATGYELSKVFSMIKEAEDTLLKRLRTARGMSEAGDLVSDEVQLLEGVIGRLKFLRLFSSALLCMTATDLESSSGNMISKSQNLTDAEKSLKACEEILDKISQSIDRKEAENDGNFGDFMAFEPGVNQRLLPPTFPRKTRIYNRAEMVAYLQALIQRLLLVCFMLPQHSPSFSTTLEFFRYFSRGRNCLLSRTISQLTYMPTADKVMFQVPFEETLKESIRTYILPPILQQKCPLGGNEGAMELWKEVLGDLSKVFPSLVQIAGHNRARQREKLAAMLEDLGSLQEECDRLDGCLHAALVRIDPKRSHIGVIGSFVLYHCLKVMLEYMLLGFELQLYSVYEYAYLYWYMGELIYKWLANVVNKAGNYIYEQEQYCVKGVKGKGESKRLQKKSKRNEQKLHRIEQVHWQTYQKLCESYFKTMMGLKMKGMIRYPDFVDRMADESLRYEHRMAPFSSLATPTFANYTQFLDMSGYINIMRHYPAERVLMEAAKCFDEARTTVESVPLDDAQEVKALVLVCKNNAVVLRLLASGKVPDSRNQPEFDFSHHKHYPLLKLAIK